MDKVKVSNTIILYFNASDATWYKLYVSDGEGTIEELKEEPQLISLDEINDEFTYPVEVFNEVQIRGNCNRCQRIPRERR